MTFKRINDIVKGGPSIILLNHITKISNIYIYIYIIWGGHFPSMPKNALKSYHSHYYTLIVVLFRAVEGEHRMGFQNRRFLFLELYCYIQIKEEKKQKQKEL